MHLKLSPSQSLAKVKRVRMLSGYDAMLLFSWTGSRYTKPTRDVTQDMRNVSIEYNSGLITFDFRRARDTGDSRDWSFTDSDGCYYFVFPVGGGSHSDSDIQRHSSTPIISTDKICISTSKLLSFY